MNLEDEIKSAVKEKKVLIGSRGAMRAARTGGIISLVYAKNTPRETIDDIQHCADVSGIKAHEYPGSSVQLGELCGKPFSILLLGIRK